MYFHTLVFFRATEACNSVSSITMETWDSAWVGETTNSAEDCISSGLPHSYKQDEQKWSYDRQLVVRKSLLRLLHLNQCAVVVIHQRPLQAQLWHQRPAGCNDTLLHLKEDFAVISMFSEPAGDFQSAVLWQILESREIVTELALHTQLRPGPCIEPQETPFALQSGVHRRCPVPMRVLPHWAIQMGLVRTEHQCH